MKITVNDTWELIADPLDFFGKKNYDTEDLIADAQLFLMEKQEKTISLKEEKLPGCSSKSPSSEQWYA